MSTIRIPAKQYAALHLLNTGWEIHKYYDANGVSQYNTAYYTPPGSETYGVSLKMPAVVLDGLFYIGFIDFYEGESGQGGIYKLTELGSKAIANGDIEIAAPRYRAAIT